MSLLKKIKQLFSNKKEEDKSSEVVQYNENPSKLEVILDGEYVYYDDEDESLLVKNYKDGKLHGPSLFHYVSGELWIEINFKDGSEHGLLTYYEKDGSIIKTETWENGECVSINKPEKTNQPERSEKKSFRDDDLEVKNEIIEEFGPKNGLVETYVDYEEDYEIVKMKCSVNYKDGEMDGLYTMTDLEGNIRLKMNYVLGVKEGLVEQFHKNGNLLNRQEFKDDIENGIDEMYDDQGNGRLVIRSNFVDGLEDSLCEYFDEEGKIFKTITFKNGEEID